MSWQIRQNRTGLTTLREKAESFYLAVGGETGKSVLMYNHNVGGVACHLPELEGRSTSSGRRFSADRSGA